MPATLDPSRSLSAVPGGSRRPTWTPLLGLALACAACSGGGSSSKKTTITTASAAANEGNAGTTDMVFTVTLSRKAQKTKRFDFATLDGTATAPSDYTAVSGVLVIPKGATQGTISVPIVGDLIAELDESFTLTVTSESGKQQPTTTGLIRDDDAPPAPVLAVAAGGVKQLSFSWAQVIAAANYRLLADPDGASGFTQTVADLQGPAGGYDQTVPVHLTNWTGARYALEACNLFGCAQSNPVSIASEMLGVIGLGKASSPGAGDGLGYALAVSGDGSTLALGAPGEASAATGIGGDELDDSAPGAGAVYVFARSGSAWVQEAYVKASNTEAGDGFGFALALSFDGSTLAVGADGEDSSATGVGGDPFQNAASQSGAVYVFTRSAGVWAEESYLKATNTGADDRFGARLGLSAGGDVLVVGAPGEDSDAVGVGGDPFNDLVQNSGAVYLLTRSAGSWTHEAYVKASNTDVGDAFGSGVAISGDGGTLAAGAPGEDSASAGLGGDPFSNAAPDSGAVYVFTGAGSSWTQELYAKASNAETGDVFGNSLGLSFDGSALLVSATGEDGSAPGLNGNQFENDFKDSGAGYLFTRAGASWTQELYIKSSRPGADDDFGRTLAIAGSGDVFAIGAPGEDGSALGIGGDQLSNAAPDSGAVYAFERPQMTWRQASYVKATNTEAGDAFGRALALSGDGATLLVGAPDEDGGGAGFGGDPDDNSVPGSGALYLY